MEIPAHLFIYANPPFNYLGTTLFLSYILLALYFTFSISISLYRQYKRLPALKAPEDVKHARARHIKIYAFLASISFAILSYNMLNFLIQSLTTWARTRNLLGQRVALLDLGDWMLQTNLFETFAQELVMKRPSAAWTQVALLETWFWNVWMAHKAQQHNLTLRTITPYILLSQILPITFTACLFTIQLHLDALGLSPSKKTIKQAKPNPSVTSKEAPKAPIKKSSLTIPTLLLNASVLALPTLRPHALFTPLILFTRLMLLVPHTGRIRFTQQDILQSVSISFGFVVAALTMSRGSATYREIVAGVRNGGFAVKALGYDALLGGLVCVVLGWGGGV